MRKLLPLLVLAALALAACTPGTIYRIDVTPGDGVPIVRTPANPGDPPPGSPDPGDPDDPTIPGPCETVAICPPIPVDPPPDPPTDPGTPPVDPPGPPSEGDCRPGNGYGDPNHCHTGPPGRADRD